MNRSIKNSLEAILDVFRRWYGVEVDIDVRVHNLADGTERPTRELAERIISELANEIGGTKPRHASYDEDERKVAWVSTERDNIQITVFYPYTEYHQSTTEGNNERESGT